MAKSNSFAKGNTASRGKGRPKGSKDKSTGKAREMIASFIDGNAGRLNKWLDEVYKQDGPRAAFQCFSDLIEYHVPKLARNEVTGPDEGPVELVISWQEKK
jgi:hypothetical protein